MIPKFMIRSVPEKVDPEQEKMWRTAKRVNPDWQFVTYRDPIDASKFPRTSPFWHRCSSGAQLAGLVRLEALWNHGGVWIDSDFECYRSFNTLLGCGAFAGHEDPGVVPDAVIGAEARHPAIDACLKLAIQRIQGRKRWPEGPDAWSTGPGVTTTVFRSRDDVLLLPPGSFYPYHYTVKGDVDRAAVKAENPWAFGAHHWSYSWASQAPAT